MVVTIGTCGPLFFVGWKYLFRDCPRVSEIPPGHRLGTVGFTKLGHTYRKMSSDLPGIPIFLAAISCSEAASGAFPTIATTYMSEYLEMTALEIGLALLIVLSAGIPGAWLGHLCCQGYTPVVSAQMCLVLYIVVTAAASWVLTPQRKQLAYLFGFLWGICQGWMHPQHTTIFVTLTPPSMEWMGVFLFACQILGFLPPLVFTILNEAGLSMQWGMASLILYFVAGFVGLVQMGDYAQAMERVQPQSHHRHSVVAAEDIMVDHDRHHPSGLVACQKAGTYRSID
jgi:UMF1 family MFS transporter